MSETGMGQPDVDAGVSAAMAAVIKALEGIPAEARERVVDAASALFGLKHGGPVRLAARPGGVADESTAHSAGAKPMSIAEFIKTAQPATNAQRIACFAYHREHHELKGRFGRMDLLPYFALSRAAKPGNYARDFNEAVREGWIHEDGPNSYITSAGERAVEAGFGGKAKPRGAAVAKK